MLEKVKNIILKTDSLLFEKFGSNRSTKSLEIIKEAQTIFSCLNKVGEECKVRFVGGCVRKALYGEIIDDIDLATSLTPDQVKNKLNGKNIKIIDTGISHGTLTLIINKKKFEITTLRKDIRTDGRHAKVEFTSSWEEDASRRDFTINSIYSDIEGRIYDPLGGIPDLRNGKIKFIGSTEKRIQEDYLRILRYLRFFLQYSKVDHDENIIKLIKQNINGLNKISNERIFDELKKIMTLKNIYNLFQDKQSKEIIVNVFPQFKFFERLKVFNKLNEKLKSKYDYKIMLAILILDHSSDYEFFCYKYKTPNELKDKFTYVTKNYENIKKRDFFSEENIKKLIYYSNKNNVQYLLLFSKFIKSKLEDLDLQKLLDYVEICKIPKFPISGDDLKKYGFKTGEELGKKLKTLEDQWIKNGFIIDKKFIESSLNKVK